MTTMTKDTKVGVLGAGAMGAGIAQIAATYGHPVVVFEISPNQREKARAGLEKILNRQVDKGRMDATQVAGILGRIEFVGELDALEGAGLVIEAVVEKLSVKQELFANLDRSLAEDAILASNTSSLSIASIGSACRMPERVVGIHFFNPAPLMPLVEIIPCIATNDETTQTARSLIDAWGKVTVIAKDTPGFIVNRVARNFYGEAIRMLEEGVADVATIDWALKTLGGFRMGPFELMDLIGNDVNFKVSETVWRAFFGDARYRPTLTQQRLVESGRLGRKTGRGYYDYSEGAERPVPKEDHELGEAILMRVLAMLINEAADAVFWGIASPEDVDLAMTKGVNYPKGLLRWGDELGPDRILGEIMTLRETYMEERYRPSPLLQQMVRDNARFFPE